MSSRGSCDVAPRGVEPPQVVRRQGRPRRRLADRAAARRDLPDRVVGLGQVHAAALPEPARDRRRRRDPLRGPRDLRPAGRRPRGAGPDRPGLPGVQPVPAPDRPRQLHARAAEGARRTPCCRGGRAMELLEKFGLADQADKHPDRLSGGQQQRAALVRALCTSPTLLLLDEITAALDPELVGEVLAIVRAEAEAGMTMVIATHEMAFARDVATSVCFLEGGRILEQGPPGADLQRPPRGAHPAVPVARALTARARAAVSQATGLAFGIRLRSSPLAGGVAGGGGLCTCPRLKEVRSSPPAGARRGLAVGYAPRSAPGRWLTHRPPGDPVAARADRDRHRQEQLAPVLAEGRRRAVVPAGQQRPVDLADQGLRADRASPSSPGRTALRRLASTRSGRDRRSTGHGPPGAARPRTRRPAHWSVDEVADHLDVLTHVDRDVDLGAREAGEATGRPGSRSPSATVIATSR